MHYKDYEEEFFTWLEKHGHVQRKADSYCMKLRDYFKSLQVTEQFYYMMIFAETQVG